MSIEGSCHCGGVRIVLAYAPTDINECQCSHCQKRGARWSYYDAADVVVAGKTSIYSWGDKRVEFHFCPVCGCSTHWTPTDPKRMRRGINTRMLAPEDLAGAAVRKEPGPR